jgi:hypothetical protein
MKLSRVVGQYRCNNGHEFDVRQIELKPFGTGFSAPLASIRFVDKNGTVRGGEPKADDQVLACPVCHEVHLFGFTRV